MSKKTILAVSITCLGYFLVGNKIPREEFWELFAVYTCIFVCYVYLSKQLELKEANILILLFSFFCFFNVPVLSQDYIRFIWDGKIQLAGQNPYLLKPIDVTIVNKDWFIAQMGDLSAHNFSNYPPLAQWFFKLLAIPNHIFFSVSILRFAIVLSIIGIGFYAKKINVVLGLNLQNVNFIVLNPLLIVEGVMNVHFEPIMLFFVLVSIYFLQQKKLFQAAAGLAAGIGIKLIPILALPFLFKFLGTKKFCLFCFYLSVFALLIIYPFFSIEVVNHYIATIGLWYGKFEFNGSIFYFVRDLGFFALGYNVNSLYSLLLMGIFPFVYLYLVKNQKKDSLVFMIQKWQTFLFIYFLMATTVHPWYLLNILVLCLSEGIILWSYTVIFSYWAYGQVNFHESNLILLIEYLPLLIFFLYQKLRPNNSLFSASLK